MLFVGLGNPGKEYENTRHNVGFMMVDEIVRHHGFSDYKSKFKGELSEGIISGQKIYVLKPQVFMNNSGISVSEIVRFYKIPLDKIYVFYDELDIKVGKLKIKKNGGSGGHNGIKSIDSHIGKDYFRMRIGIDHPSNFKNGNFKNDNFQNANSHNVSSYVLGKFAQEDIEITDKLIEKISKTISVLVGEGHEKFLTKLHIDNNRKKENKEKENGGNEEQKLS